MRDLRVFARGDEDQSGPVALRRVLDSSINIAWNEIRHRARLVKDYGDTPMVEGNESRLGQVFLNLLLNAAQAIPEGETERNEIRVSTRTDARGRAVVEVRDTGDGHPARDPRADLRSVLHHQAGERGDGARALDLQRHPERRSAARSRVDSEIGRGSTFRVTLPPAVMEAPGAIASPRAAEAACRAAALLVIDDEPMILGALRRSLSAEYNVTCVGDGRKALDRLRAGERYDVILCDLMMPEMTGMDLYAELEQLAPDQAARMVFVTGGAFTAARARVPRAGPERAGREADRPPEPAPAAAQLEALERRSCRYWQPAVLSHMQAEAAAWSVRRAGSCRSFRDPVQKFRVKSDWSSEQVLWQTVVDG